MTTRHPRYSAIRTLRRAPSRLFRHLPHVRNTNTFRLTVKLGAVFVVAVLLLLGLTYELTESELISRTDQVLYNETHRLTGVPRAQLPKAMGALIADGTSGLNYYALIDADGRVMAGNFVPQSIPRARVPVELPAGQGAPVPLRALVTRASDGTRIEVARNIIPIIDLRSRIFTTMVYSGIGVIVAALLAGFALSLGPLRRVAEVRGVALRIASGDLGLRMPMTSRGDELDLISGMVNAVLDEIERLMEQVKGATDAIAHDLRTPLAHLRHRLQPLTQPCDHGPTQPVGPAVAAAIEDIDLVLSRFNALLRISELEASGRQAGFALVDPMTLLADIAELYEPLAQEAGISLLLHGAYGHTIRGDETLLLEVVSNLVENALKFVGKGGHVTLSVMGEADEAIIEVRDDGPGIPEAERQFVLGRFQRGSGAGRTAGMGLGLNLVAAIVHLHGFVMTLGDGAPGLCVRIVCQMNDGDQ